MTPEQTLQKVQDFLKENQIELTVNVVVVKPELFNAINKDVRDIVTSTLTGRIVPKFVGSVTQKMEAVSEETNHADA